jgi:hypothetical protein
MKNKNQKQVEAIGELTDKFVSNVKVYIKGSFASVILEFKCGKATTMREWIVPTQYKISQ